MGVPVSSSLSGSIAIYYQDGKKLVESLHLLNNQKCWCFCGKVQEVMLLARCYAAAGEERRLAAGRNKFNEHIESSDSGQSCVVCHRNPGKLVPGKMLAGN